MTLTLTSGANVQTVTTTVLYYPPRPLRSARQYSNHYADRALFLGACGNAYGDQLFAIVLAELADRKAAQARREARSVARPPSRRAR